MVVLGEALLVAALALTGAAAASATYALLVGPVAPGRSGGAGAGAHATRRAARRGDLLGLGAVALAALSYLVLTGHFVARDYSVFYVWNYTDDLTPLWLRVAGAWAGSAGSVFLWTVLIGAAFAGEVAWQRRARRLGEAMPGERLLGVVRVVTLAAFAVFLLFTIRSLPFAPTADFHFSAATGFFTYQPGMRHLPDPLDLRPEGFGLNPLLVTPFMAIHPPMEFIAYALTTLVFAFAVGWLVTRDAGWWGGAIFWGRLAWTAYAIALALGGLWAYHVLSFGGYWAWDPVEVGDLIPFLGLTAFLHAADVHRKGRGFPHYAPLLAGLVFPLTLFGTFVTRSSYWISAHAFDVGAAAVVTDPALRLLGVVAAKEQTAAVLALMLVVLAALATLFLWRFLRDKVLPRRRELLLPTLAVMGAYVAVMAVAALDVHGLLAQGFGLAALLGGGDLLLGIALLGLLLVGVPVGLMVWSLEDEEEPEPLQVDKLLGAEALMNAGVILLSLMLLVTLAILLVGVNFTVTQLGDTFRARMPLLVLPLTLVLTMRLSVKSVGPRRAAAYALGALVVGVALFLTLPRDLRLLGLGVPVLSVALAAGVVQLVKAAGKGSGAPRDARRAGALLLVASLAGFAMWASPPAALRVAGAVVHVPWEMAFLGLPAAMATYLAGVAVLNGRGGPRMALLGGAAAVAGFGYGLGAALGLAALALAWRAHRRAPGASREAAQGRSGLRHAMKQVRGRLYGASRWAAHVAILLVFIGYGASAYHSAQADFEDLANPLERGVPQAFGPYTLTLMDSTGLDEEGDGTFERVTAHIAVERGGALLDVAPIAFYWVDKENQYRPTEHVLRQPLEDVYLNSNPRNLPKMRTEADGWVLSNQQALFDPGNPQGKMRSDAVDAVALSVKRLPMVAPLWAGAAMLPFMMAVTLASAPPRQFAKVPKAAGAGANAGAAPAGGAAGAAPRDAERGTPQAVEAAGR